MTVPNEHPVYILRQGLVETPMTEHHLVFIHFIKLVMTFLVKSLKSFHNSFFIKLFCGDQPIHLTLNKVPKLECVCILTKLTYLKMIMFMYKVRKIIHLNSQFSEQSRFSKSLNQDNDSPLHFPKPSLCGVVWNVAFAVRIRGH